MEEEKNSDLHLTCLADEMNDECDETILFTVIEKRAVLCVCYHMGRKKIAMFSLQYKRT